VNLFLFPAAGSFGLINLSNTSMAAKSGIKRRTTVERLEVLGLLRKKIKSFKIRIVVA